MQIIQNVFIFWMLFLLVSLALFVTAGVLTLWFFALRDGYRHTLRLWRSKS